MKDAIKNWLQMKWRDEPAAIAQDYQMTFGTAAGQRVMAHLMDTIYCSVYEGLDPIGLAEHNAARKVVHNMLEILDAIENPRKARFNPVVETESHFMNRGA
jgi:hypothetical protein